ncbi:MAG: reverse gyrase [bacterium]
MIDVLYNEELRDLVNFDVINQELKEFEEFFENCFGYKLKSIQRTYVKRVFLNMSFSIQAPTGTGKTVLGIFLALYFSLIKNKKSLLIFPTQLLVKQSFNIYNNHLPKIKEYIKKRYFKEILEDRVLFFISDEKKNIKQEIILKIESKEYDFLAITNNFLARNFELLRNNVFNLIFVDDLDSVSKSSKNTDRILMLLGFHEDFIKEVKNRDFNLTEEQKSQLDNYPKNILIISSATLRRGLNTILFSKLLKFDVGSSVNFVRNIDDIFLNKKDINKLLFILEKMGPGGIIFTNSLEDALKLEKIIPNSKVITSKTTKYIDKLVDLYEDILDEQNIEDFFNNDFVNEKINDIDSKEVNQEINGEINEEVSEEVNEEINEEVNEEVNEEDILDFVNENDLKKEIEGVSYLIGVASPYSILTRGLDLPYKIRYVVFWGLPKRRIDLNNLDNYKNLYPIQKFLSNLFFKRKMVSLDRIKEYIKNMEDNTVISSFVIIDKILYSIDIKTYLQASGRCSRITPNGITKGVSFIFEDQIFFEPFKKLAYFNNFEVKQMDLQLDFLINLKKEVDDSRSKEVNNKVDIDFKTYLMIVESPTKAKQIASMFGVPSVIKIDSFNGYEVFSPIGILIIVPSVGHVVELSVDSDYFINNNGNQLNFYNVIVEFNESKDNKKITKCNLVYSPIKRCRSCNKSFASKEDKCIYCSSTNVFSSFKYLEKLKIISYLVDGVILATDPDSEGEKISFDIFKLLNPINFHRVTFNEITKKAVINSLNNLRNINFNMVNSQLVRRIEDRWIGFSLSSFLRENFDDKNLSAGRVQSPVLDWIVNRYKEYSKKRNFAVVNEPNIGNLQFIDSKIKGKANLKVEIIDKTEKEVILPPFNTPDILSFANSVLKLSSNEVMNLLQKLFENGLITYHRTDSYRVSNLGIDIAKEILDKNNLEFIYRNFDNSVHAHEAIRITKPLTVEDLKIFYQDKLPFQAFRLYEMIYKRFINAFTKPTKLIIYSYKFTLFNDKEENILYQDRVVDIVGPNIFPYISQKSEIILEGIYNVKVSNVKKPVVTLYSQADIVKLMKDKEIGRPSTYAHIISRLFLRGYIIEKYNKIIPMKKGILVNEKLNSEFWDLVNEERTRELQKKMDLIEEGVKDPIEVVNELYQELNEKVFTKLSNFNLFLRNST